MKITQENAGFTPITITLETEEEAIALYYRLFVGPESVTEYAELNRSDPRHKAICSGNLPMFLQFSTLFDPSQED